MYSIVYQLDGKIRGSCTIQDGTETDFYASKEEAIKSLINAAKVMNGMNITERDIKFGKEVQKIVIDVEWEKLTCRGWGSGDNHCSCCHCH